MKFESYEGPVHVAGTAVKSAHWLVTAYCSELGCRVVVGEFPYDESEGKTALRKETARIMAGRLATYEKPLRPRAWVKEGDNGEHSVSFGGQCPEDWNDIAYALFGERDNCELCFGTKGGVRGNENIINGQIVCDYCHASM